MAEAKYTWGDIIIDPTSDRAKEAVGKQVYYSQFPNVCLLRANNDDRVLQGILISIDPKNLLGSFIVDGSPYACIIVKKKPSYKERSERWVEENDLKVGDYVKVTRKAESREGGCDYLWNYRMDNSVGKILKVEEIKTRNGVITLEDACCYPYFVLEKVEPPKPKYVPFESKEEFVRRYKEVKKGADFDTFEDNLFQCGMWLKSMCLGNFYQVTIIKKSGIFTDDDSCIITWEKLLEKYTFLDGSPCGKEVKDE